MRKTDKFCLQLGKGWYIIFGHHAGVMELVDVVDSKSTGGDTVPVRARPPAPKETTAFYRKLSFPFFLFSLFTILSSLQAVISAKRLERREKRKGIPFGDDYIYWM